MRSDAVALYNTNKNNHLSIKKHNNCYRLNFARILAAKAHEYTVAGS
jgi:hypothetical protein